MKTAGKIYALAAAALLSTSIKGQVFEKVYPTTYDRTARDVIRVSDGYLITGMTNNSNQFDCDLYLMKTNLMGEFQWEKIFGGGKPDYAYSMVETHDGYYLIVGYTQSFGGGDYDMYWLKVDGAGNKIKEVDYGGTGNEEARQIIRTSDNKYVIVGTSAMASGSGQVWLLKVNSNFDVEWSKEYGGSSDEFGLAVREAPDGGFVVGGQTFSMGNGGGDGYVVKTTSSGEFSWNKAYGDAENEEVVGLLCNDDGSSILAVRDSSAQDIDVRMIRIDNSGTEIWNKVYGGSMKDTPKTLERISGNEYLVGAISRSWWPAPQMWIMKMVDNGTSADTAWTRNFGMMPDHDHCHNAKYENGFILAAGHNRQSVQQVYFLKLNNEGRLIVGNDEEKFNGGTMTLFPNPGTGVFSVAFRNVKPDAIRVTDLLGREVLISEGPAAGSETVSLDLSGKSSGIYLVTVKAGEASVTKKLIVE